MSAKSALASIKLDSFVNSDVRVKKIAKFQRLSYDGIDINLIDNPVIRMLAEGNSELSSGRRCSIAPEDEWLIFLD